MCGLCAGAEPSSNEVEYIMAGMLDQKSRIETFECDVERRTQGHSGSQATEHFHFRYKSGKEWIRLMATTRSRVSVRYDVLAWDGKVARALKEEADEDRSRYVGAAMPDLTELYNTPFGIWWRQKPCGIDNLLRFYKINISGTEQVGSVECKVMELRARKAPSLQEKADRLYVSTETFLPMRYENFLKDGTLQCRWDYEYEIHDGVFYPKLVKQQFFHEKSEQVVTVSLQNVKINEPISDEKLRISFPKGTRVLDHVTGFFITVGAIPDDALLNWDELALDGLEVQAKPGRDEVSGPSQVSSPISALPAGKLTDEAVEGQLKAYAGTQQGRRSFPVWQIAGIALGAVALVFALIVVLRRVRATS